MNVGEIKAELFLLGYLSFLTSYYFNHMFITGCQEMIFATAGVAIKEIIMSTTLVTQFCLSNGIRSLTPIIGLYFSDRTKASTVAVDSLSDAERTLLASAKPFQEIPTVRILPLIGSSWIYFPIIGKYKISKFHLADVGKYKTYGSIFREKFGHQDIVSIFEPTDVEKMYRYEGQYPSRGEIASLKAYRETRKEWYKTKGLLLLEGKEWYDLRSKVQTHMMRPKVIQAYIQPMESVAQDLVKRMSYLRDEKKEVPHFLEELYKWSLESVVFVGLDTRLGCLGRDLPADSESLKMIKSVQTIFDCMNKMELFSGSVQLWKFFPTPTWRKFVKANDFFTITALKYINKALEDIKNKDEDNEMTLLQSMLCTPGLDVSGAISTVSDMLMAGIDTTSHTTGFILYRLAQNPNVQEKLHEEIVRVLPNRSDRLNSAALNELRYLKACIKESMRLDPIVRGNGRRLDHDIVLSGYRIPPGVIIFAAGQVASKLEKNFKNADKFIPERWLSKEVKRHPFLSVPFGFGTRSCIGRRLAELEIQCLITEIIRNYKVEYHHEDIGMLTRLINIPDRPLKFSFTDRPF